ncbi:hypothetical protein C1645_876620 [Glomus cerebriforme]|uniref:F-box domain-containing protein n=1 Tax=Glomus cerebriforme TaxID=658196 RepID=A0A397STU5_9GLOM|nr:hypothetical protein C1645_876620 [Glomus cerebriforme]
MSSQLSTDCLDKIFEYLENDKATLYSCLLVDRLWCRVSVMVLWRKIWNVETAPKSILDTLIACLPNESKDLLIENGIVISPTSRPPLFNYPSFCKILSIYNLISLLEQHDPCLKNYLVMQELLKMFMNQISSLKELTYDSEEDDDDCVDEDDSDSDDGDDDDYCGFDCKCECHGDRSNDGDGDDDDNDDDNDNNDDDDDDDDDNDDDDDDDDDDHIEIPNFINFPGARDCLTNLSKLNCSSKVYPGFFHQLSQICHDIQSLYIRYVHNVPVESKDLISSQNNLKSLTFIRFYDVFDYSYASPYSDCTKVVPSLSKHSNTLTKLHLQGYGDYGSLSFITKFTNLRELYISLDYENAKDFKEIQHHTFPYLENLHFRCPDVEIVINFLEINGKTLKNISMDEYDKSLHLAIARFCPNLKSLDTEFCEQEPLKAIFINCIHLESICIDLHGNGKEFLELVAKFSPENFHELKFNNYDAELLPEYWESFFTSWKDHTPQKSISLNFRLNYSTKLSDEHKKLMERYKNLGVIKQIEYKRITKSLNVMSLSLDLNNNI